MIERSARSADYLDRPEVRSTLRARPVATYLGARRGVVGYGLLVAVAAAAAVEAWRSISPWLGLALALVSAHALVDLAISWYRVASLPYLDAVEHQDDEDVGEEAAGEDASEDGTRGVM